MKMVIRTWNMTLSHNFTMQIAFSVPWNSTDGPLSLLHSENIHPHHRIWLSWALLGSPRPFWAPLCSGSRGLSLSLLSFPGLSWVKDVWISCGHRPNFSLRHVSSSSALWGQGIIETTLPELNLTRTRQELEFAAWDSNTPGGGVGPDHRVALCSGPWLKWFSFFTAFKKDMTSASQNMSIFITAQLAHFWKIKKRNIKNCNNDCDNVGQRANNLFVIGLCLCCGNANVRSPTPAGVKTQKEKGIIRVDGKSKTNKINKLTFWGLN